MPIATLVVIWSRSWVTTVYVASYLWTWPLWGELNWALDALRQRRALLRRGASLREGSLVSKWGGLGYGRGAFLGIFRFVWRILWAPELAHAERSEDSSSPRLSSTSSVLGQWQEVNPEETSLEAPLSGLASPKNPEFHY